jgi:hypothetical protein
MSSTARHRQSPSAGRLSTVPVLTALVVIALVLALSGYRDIEPASADVYVPATVEEIADSEVKLVTFTEEGAERVDLATAIAQPSGPYTAVPYAALIYDGQGVTWVYTNAKPLTFLRAKVVVDRVEGDVVLLSDGVLPGTAVVTVGAIEVYGAELGIEGGH